MSKKNHISSIAYGIVIGALHLVALLPLGVLYVFSDILFFLIYYIVKYRRKVVFENLKACFNDKSDNEIRSIARKFYRNFADYIFETVKLLHISDRQICRRMTFDGLDVMDNMLVEGKDITVYFSHTMNWEWATSVPLHSRYPEKDKVEFGQIYRPLRNRVMDRVMLRIRSRFNTRCIPKSTSLRHLVSCRRHNRLFVVGFMSDQKPSHGDPKRIISFFGRPTAVITGTETLARRLDTAVVYWRMSKPSRGHYHIDVIPMSENAANTQPDELTAHYFSLLQENITASPDLWLWTHKRWKTSPSDWNEVLPESIIKTHRQ